MRRKLHWLPLVLAGICLGQAPGEGLRSLVEAERSFARRSEEKGTKEAFLAYLAEESIVFRPRPVDGRKSYSDWAGSRALLAWRPVYADISRAGDLGYTTGPFERFESPADRKRLGQGHYVSLWRRQADGEWKVVLDSGISHPPLPEKGAPPDWSGPAAEASAAAPGGRAAAEKEILELEAGLAAAGPAAGESAVLSRMAAEARVYRPDRFPAVGLEAAKGLLRGPELPLAWRPMKAAAAESGDLGYVYGIAVAGPGADPAFGPAAEMSYLRIWKKSGGGWRVVLDLAAPIPRTAA